MVRARGFARERPHERGVDPADAHHHPRTEVGHGGLVPLLNAANNGGITHTSAMRRLHAFKATANGML